MRLGELKVRDITPRSRSQNMTGLQVRIPTWDYDGVRIRALSISWRQISLYLRVPFAQEVKR